MKHAISTWAFSAAPLTNKGLFGSLFFIIQFSSLITLNIKVVWYNHSISITHYFSHYLGGPHLSRCSFFFFFLFSIPRNPNPVKKKKERTQWRRKEKKKKSQLVKSCYWMGPSCVFNYKNTIELWVMETEKSYGNWKQLKGVFSFHNS